MGRDNEACSSTDECCRQPGGGPIEEQKPMLYLVASMFLKKRNKSLALVQRCISVFLYGNACSKQVRLHAGSV